MLPRPSVRLTPAAMSSYPPSTFPSSSLPSHQRPASYSPLASLPIPQQSRISPISSPPPQSPTQLHLRPQPSPSQPPPPPPPPPTPSRLRLPMRPSPVTHSVNSTLHPLKTRSSTLTLISACSSSTTLNSINHTQIPLFSSSTLLLTNSKPSHSLISSPPSSSSSPTTSTDCNCQRQGMSSHANTEENDACGIQCCRRLPRETPAEILLSDHVQHNEEQARIIRFHVSHRRVLRARSFSLALRATRRLISTLHAMRAAARAREKRAAVIGPCACDDFDNKKEGHQIKQRNAGNTFMDGCSCHCCLLSSSSSVSLQGCPCKSRVTSGDDDQIAANDSGNGRHEGLPSASTCSPGDSRAGIQIGVGGRCSSSRTGRSTSSSSSSSSSSSHKAKGRTRVIYEAPRRVDGLHASLRVPPVTRRGAQSCPKSSSGATLLSKSKQRKWKSSTSTSATNTRQAGNTNVRTRDGGDKSESSPPNGVKPTSRGRVIGPHGFVRVRGRGRLNRHVDPTTTPITTTTATTTPIISNGGECVKGVNQSTEALLAEKLNALEQSLRASRERALRASADVSAAQDVFVLLSIFLGLSTNLAPHPNARRSSSCFAVTSVHDDTSSPGTTGDGTPPPALHSPTPNVVRTQSQTQFGGSAVNQRHCPQPAAGNLDSKLRRRLQRRRRMVRPVSAPVLGAGSSADSLFHDAQRH